MPDIDNGRKKVSKYLKQHNIKKRDLAIAYGYKPQEVTNILNGSTKGPAANKFILRVIADYSIE